LKKNDMERLFDIIISWRTFKTVHWHTVMHGVGAILPEDIINVELQLGHDIPDYMTLSDMIDYENEIDDEDECNEYDM
jgi:hypothetical protein